MLLIIKILFKINCFDTLNDEKSLEYFLEKENFHLEHDYVRNSIDLNNLMKWDMQKKRYMSQLHSIQ